MHSIPQDMAEFRQQLRGGSVQRAYRSLLTYISGLRTRFQSEHPDCAVSGLYQGYMDMTYFAFVPPPLKQRGLKIAIVFNYEAFRFEAWLAASNRQVQQRYWGVVRNGAWGEYRVVAHGKGVDSIIECALADGFGFHDLDSLTQTIEQRTAEFVDRIVDFLSEHDGG